MKDIGANSQAPGTSRKPAAVAAGGDWAAFDAGVLVSALQAAWQMRSSPIAGSGNRMPGTGSLRRKSRRAMDRVP
ncbi:MAG: hypothetical protein AMXMBFR8_14450 [Nevskiales bacterium]